MKLYQVTLDIALLWSADARRNRILLTSKISIALAIHSLDLRWSENHFTKKHPLKDCHRSKDECYLLEELFRQGYGMLYTFRTTGAKDCKTRGAENNRSDYLWCEHDPGILDAFPLQNRTVPIDISPESARMSPIQK